MIANSKIKDSLFLHVRQMAHRLLGRFQTVADVLSAEEEEFTSAAETFLTKPQQAQRKGTLLVFV